MKLFNSLSKSLEDFVPEDDPITLYVCGITPYDTTHLGHAFTYTIADVLVRYMEFQGREVRYVQNVTDIDDDILKRANETGEDWRALVSRWTRRFIDDMKALNVRPPDEFPRATSVIPEIIKTVMSLLETGIAYSAGGSVYFDVNAWDEYGKLSRLPREEMLPIANERGNNPDDPNKRDPLDFVLWQAQAPGEPAWDSPWGPGRPGWHIECSTMSTCLLDDTVDIHMGGEDLIFPHHESEIAQVEPASGKKPFVKYWLHVAMVHHEGEKMSKSLGNLVMARDLLDTWPADALRLYLAFHHYREAWSYDQNRLEAAAQLAHKLKTAANAESGSSGVYNPKPPRHAFLEAMDDDLDTPGAISALSAMATEIMGAAVVTKDITAGQDTLRSLAGILGLTLDSGSAEDRVGDGWDRHLQQF